MTSFPNMAGKPDIDDALAAELEAAGIEVHRLSVLKNGKSEVNTEVIGGLHGWSFERAWYYWRCSGPGIEVAAAERLHAAHGKDVRVAGHCGCPSPTEWFKGLAVGDYHVDTPAGLKALAETIKRLVDHPSDHGKPDGAVRTESCEFCFGTGRHGGRFSYNDPDCTNCNGTGKVAALHSSKIAAAETSPGDVVAMKEALLRDQWSILVEKDDRTSPEEYPEMCLITREEVGGIIAAAIDRLDVKAEAKSQEPVAVAWRRRRKGIVGNGGWIMCPEYPGRDREFDLEHLYTHPTKPEAPAVSVDAIKDIAAERKRQWHVEGWSPAHDDTHVHGELAKAAACYAVGYIIRGHTVSLTRTNSWSLWSWDLEWWKPKDCRRNLVRAGALIVAEIERLDRAALIDGER